MIFYKYVGNALPDTCFFCKKIVSLVSEIQKMIDCCIFDLDGVVVDTARYHYLAWAALARELGFEFTPVQGEATKGVSRMASLEIVLRAGGLEGRFSAAERERLAAEKNARYLRFVSQMTPAEPSTVRTPRLPCAWSSRTPPRVSRLLRVRACVRWASGAVRRFRPPRCGWKPSRGLRLNNWR